MKEDCLFCQIVEGKIPAKKVFENDKILAFEDIAPKAKIHILFIPKIHSENILEMTAYDDHLVQDLFQAIHDYATQKGLDQTGFRLITNLGAHGGQEVFHTHVHLLAGEHLGSLL